MSGLVLRTLGEVFGASWAVLAVLWRPLGTSWAVFWGIPEAPDAPRRPKMIARRTEMASHRQGERSDQDETALAEHKRRRRNSNGVAGATGLPRGVRKFNSHTKDIESVHSNKRVSHA